MSTHALGIILLISYYCHSHLILNYKIRNPISNKNKNNKSNLCNTRLLISLYKPDVQALQKVYWIYMQYILIVNHFKDYTWIFSTSCSTPLVKQEKLSPSLLRNPDPTNTWNNPQPPWQGPLPP